MRKKQVQRKIPENIGNNVCGVEMCIASIVCNAILHIVLFFFYQPDFFGFVRLFVSFIFFIWPFHYVADILWTLRPSVSSILCGRLQVNRKYYMNTARKEVEKTALLPVTISIPVYMEGNNVIFQTLRESQAAAKRYCEFSGQTADILVSDDGIAPMLGENCTKEKSDALVQAFINNPSLLTQQEMKVAERIHFYRKYGIAFVVRPASGRKGLFKKSSNLNYTLHLGNAIAEGMQLDTLTQKGGMFEGGYGEGNIITNEIILLLDKDSGVNERIIEAIVPEFIVDEKLAYVQCATIAINLYDNYYSYATGHQTNSLFQNIWPCRALQGFFVPLVGHNVFMRKSILEKSGFWAEDRVSEDFDKAICLYNMGYHGKYAQLKGLEFSEYASRTFTEETGKQYRYSYGLFEMIFDGTLRRGKTRNCDLLYMYLYFFSVINQVMLLPTVLIECYFGDIHLLWAGFLFCILCFIILPYIRGLVMRAYLPKEQTENLMHTVLIAFSFVGHSFSMLKGMFRYLMNKIKENTTSFPSTNVDRLEYRFSDGVRLLADFFRKNKLLILLEVLCLDRGIFMLTRKGIGSITVAIYCYILFSAVLVPFLMTPHLYAGLRIKPNRLKAGKGSRHKNHMKKEIPMNRKNREKRSMDWNTSLQMSSPRLVYSEQSLGEEATAREINNFLSAYNEILQDMIPDEHMPQALTVNYSFESCIRKDPEGKKEIYLIKRRTDGMKALLRITKDYPEEDALEEAELLSKLNHPGISKVYDSYEQDGKKYIIREYIEGRSLYEIVKSTNGLSTEDIYSIMLKLSNILIYLHAQQPPVIHRDIKPQNIIVGKDGSIHLIDFGIARIHNEERRQDTSVVLTLDYASPEQYGFEQTTPLSDIYSLGVLMLFMATQNTARSGLESQVVNNHLRNLIEHCIAFNPTSRFQSVNELCNYIQKDTNQQSAKRRRKLGLAISLAVVTTCLSACFYGVGTYRGKNQGNADGHKRGYDIGYTDGFRVAPVFKTGEMSKNVKNGNIPGNMGIDGGSFVAQGDDCIFYISDGNIYKMQENGANAELFVRGKNANALSYRDGWLYYSSGLEILQTNIYTLKSDVLCQDINGELHVVNDNYYIKDNDGIHLYNTTTSDITLLKELSDFEYVNIDEETMYFIHKDNRALYHSGLDGEAPTKMFNGVCNSVCVFDEDIYCSAYSNGSGTLLKISGTDGGTITLAEVNAANINATAKGIYFIDTFDRTINVCSLDGSIQMKISKNRAKDFNIAGDWIFYHNEADNDRLWCVRLDGTNDHPAQAGR